MQEKKENNTRPRLFLAFALSMAVLLGWSYWFAPKPPNVPVNESATPQPAPAAATATQAALPAVQEAAITKPATISNVPNRKLRIKTSLFESTFDSKGAVASSWEILRDKSPQEGTKEIWADGSTPNNQKRLQLINQDTIEGWSPELPFRLITGDQSFDKFINESEFVITTPDEVIELKDGEERTIEFLLTGENNTEVKKTFTFRGGEYVADLKLTVTRGGQPVSTVKVAIGASIGDRAINNHNFYHIESEAVGSIGGHIIRHQGPSFTYNQNKGALSDPGLLDWAGVGDAYFAMVAIPSRQTEGIEYSSFQYQHQTAKPFYDGIISWILRREKSSETRHMITAFVPVPADGSVTKIFTGTKDYFLLSDLNDKLSKDIGRQIDIEDLINFSNYRPIRYITKPLSIPIIYALSFLNNFTSNYGIAIVIFTFFFYSLLFPLRLSQTKSFKKAAGNAPKMKEIQDKIKALQKKGVPMESPEMRQLQMEQLKMTKDALPIGGCLPMLLQFPLLIAFYTAVTVSLSLRQANFLWLPDLSAGDPYHILEFAFAISMVPSMKFTPTSPSVTPEQQMQQKIMIYLMPVMMLWIMWQAPSGLLLYWFFGNIVSFGQQMIINRMNRVPQSGNQELVDSVPKNAKKIK